MLFIYDKKKGIFSPTEKTDFKSHEIMERRDIEKWVTDFPKILGEDLLIITTEYDKFDKTKERLDLLALDKKGKLVIIELKGDEGGKNVELQAIKYAAFCSTLTMDDLVPLRKKFVSKNSSKQTDEEVKKELYDFISNDDFEELDDKPRIMIVATDFRLEVTASVLWLRKFGLDISCIKLTPHKIGDDRIGIVSSVLIPLPEAEEYIIKAEKKDIAEKSLTRTQQEYLSFYRELAQAFREKNPSVPLPEPKPKAYYQIPTDIGGVHFEWIFYGSPRTNFAVSLHFEKSDKDTNKMLLKEIEKYKDEIEKQTQSKVIFTAAWGKDNAWTGLWIESNEGKMTNELKEWAVEKMTILYKLLQPKLDKKNIA